MLFGKAIDDIKDSDLQDLVNNKIPEDQTLEYKRQMYAPNDNLEILRDISSFANAFGGDVVIGIEEKGGVAQKVIGIQDAETAKSRIVKLCLACIHARIMGLAARAIPVTGDGHVLVVRIPRSLQAPHMISWKGRQEFWRRHGTDKSMMSVEEIGAEFVRASSLRESLEKMLERKEAELVAEAKGEPLFVICASPIFIREDLIATDDQSVRQLLGSPPRHPAARGWGLVSGAGSPRPTLWGLEVVLPHENTHLVLDRSGYAEFATTSGWTAAPHPSQPDSLERLNPYALVCWTLNFLKFYRTLVEQIGLFSAIVVKLAMHNIQGMGLEQTLRELPFPRTNTWNRNNLPIGPIPIAYNFAPELTAKELLDRVWNAFHWEFCDGFDDQANPTFKT